MINILGYAKLLPYALLIGGLAYATHSFIVNQKDDRIQELENQVTEVIARNVALQTTDQIQKETIKSLGNTIDRMQSDVDDLSRKLTDITVERDEYLSIFRRHDLTNLSLAKPGLIERRINKGTKDVFRQLEEDSKELYDESN